MRAPNINSLTPFTIVLDLDETLVHTFEEPMEPWFKRNGISDDCYERLYELSDTGNTPTYGLLRPQVRQFLIFCFAYFRHVIIWSAGIHDYVHEIAEILTQDIADPHLILSREHCHNSTPDEPEYTKPLSKLLDYPGLRIEEIIVLDDRESTFCYNPKNAIHIPTYAPNTENLEILDRALSDIYRWFMRPEVIRARDVRSLNKNEIFKP